MESSISSLDRVMTLETTTMFCPGQGCTGRETAAEEMFKAPYICPLAHFLLLPPPLIIDFSRDSGLDRKKKFPAHSL